jgi:hypothetical protein
MTPPVVFARDVADGCTVSIRVQPGARANGVTGLYNGALKIALAQPPVDGRANEALIAFVAELLGLPKSRVHLVGGASSRQKLVRVEGKSAAEIEAALSPVITC